jgi:hypothetical protein
MSLLCTLRNSKKERKEKEKEKEQVKEKDSHFSLFFSSQYSIHNYIKMEWHGRESGQNVIGDRFPSTILSLKLLKVMVCFSSYFICFVCV